MSHQIEEGAFRGMETKADLASSIGGFSLRKRLYVSTDLNTLSSCLVVEKNGVTVLVTNNLDAAIARYNAIG